METDPVSYRETRQHLRHPTVPAADCDDGPIRDGLHVRRQEDQRKMARDDYRNPGPYKYPAGTVAYEVDTPVKPARQETPTNAKPSEKGGKPTQMKGMKM
jgi:hypothetical protein